MNQSVNPSLRRIYQRTFKGQAAVVAGACANLGEQPRQILLMVNGFTPLQHLAGLSASQAEVMCRMVESLEEQGLIKEADGHLAPLPHKLKMNASRPA